MKTMRSALADVHVVFLSDVAPEPAQVLVRTILPDYTLSIGDHETLARIGVMLALSTDVNKVVFYANLDAIERSEVKLSSKLLRLAKTPQDR